MSSAFDSSLELPSCEVTLEKAISSPQTSVSPLENGNIGLGCPLRILQLSESMNRLPWDQCPLKTVCKNPHMHKPSLMYMRSRRQPGWCE